VTDYSFTTEVGIRFRDVDAVGHVNNAVYATYVEQARIEYLRDVFGESLVDGRSVLAHIEIDFERSIGLGAETATVGVGVTDVGTTSIEMDYEVRVGSEVVATAETVLVTTDEGGPTPVPEEWRTAIAEYEDL
jgi:acyl-CoA thioester hydrolase